MYRLCVHTDVCTRALCVHMCVPGSLCGCARVCVWACTSRGCVCATKTSRVHVQKSVHACARFMTTCVCVFIPVCACLQKVPVCVFAGLLHTCVCLQVCCTCVCAVCVHRDSSVCRHTWAGQGLLAQQWPTGLTLSLCPPCPSPAPASHPPEGSEAEWRHRYRSVPAAAWCLPGLCPRASWAPLGAAWVQDWPFPARCPLSCSALPDMAP